jgi:DNA topoisomerase IA
MTEAERVILIQGDADKWYEQAIFIVKPNTRTNAIPKNMVDEAEQIIASYLLKNNKPLPAGMNPARPNTRSYANKQSAVTHSQVHPARKREKKGVNFYINMMILFVCLLLAGVFFYGVML